MTKLLISLFIFLLPYSAFAADATQNVVKILNGTTIYANGTSTYIIDLNSPNFGYRPFGDFSLQFKGFTHDTLAGATINAAWRAANYLPSGVTRVGLVPGSAVRSKMTSTNIVTNMNIQTGNTEYVYGFFFIDVARYLIIDVTAGVSNMGVTAYVKVD